jgi:hypothetical protein
VEIAECGSGDLLELVSGKRWLLLAPWIRIELHTLHDLVESYLKRAFLVRGDCIRSLVGGQDDCGGAGGGDGGD